MKSFILLSVLYCLTGCEPKELKVDKYYNIFRTRNYPDSIYSSLARYIARYHPDEKKKQEARTWLTKQKQQRDEAAIMKSAFYLDGVIQLEEKCNGITKHYLATRLTTNADTLKQAINILGKSLRSQIYEQCHGWGALHTTVYLYKNMNDFDNKKYFTMASVYHRNATAID